VWLSSYYQAYNGSYCAEVSAAEKEAALGDRQVGSSLGLSMNGGTREAVNANC